MDFPENQRIWVVDTFCDRRYLGNPAAVLILDDDYPDTAVLLSIATRLALPTTAFVRAEAEGRYRIRWFTPGQELNLCGHASIAAARVLFDQSVPSPGRRLHFATGFGSLVSESRAGDGVALTLPMIGVVAVPPPPGLEAALGAKVVMCAQSVDDLVIELESRHAVATLAPDLSALKSIPCRGHVVTAAADMGEGADFVSRSFFPALGVDEDQVCVSAHCKLAPFWGHRLGKRQMTAIQLSPRGGVLGLQLNEDRVHVIGSARVRRETTLGAEIALASGGLYRT